MVHCPLVRNFTHYDRDVDCLNDCSSMTAAGMMKRRRAANAASTCKSANRRNQVAECRDISYRCTEQIYSNGTNDKRNGLLNLNRHQPLKYPYTM